jgi:hypothetical protein
MLNSEYSSLRALYRHEKISPSVTVLSPRPGCFALVRTELDLLHHVVAEFDRTGSPYNQMIILERVHRRGVWAPVREHTELSVLLTERVSYTSNWNRIPFEVYAQEIRKHLLTAPRQPHPGSWMDARFLANGERTTSRVLWSGYAINAATLAGLGLMGWGAWGVPGAIRARRVRAGKCAKCRYDLRGLGEATPRCPECGAERIERPEKDTD